MVNLPVLIWAHLTHLDLRQMQNAGEEEENAEEPALENSGRINQLLYIKATSNNNLNKSW